MQRGVAQARAREVAVVLVAPLARHEVGGGGDGLHYLAVLVAVYSVGAYGQLRDGLVAAVLLLAFVGPGEWAKLADGGGWGELVGPVLSMVLAFGMGRFVGSRTRQVRDAELRASEVERDRDAREALTTIETTGREALVELRRLLDVLHRTTDATGTGPQPGLAELPRLIGTAREAGLPVELHLEGEPVALPAGLDLSAYRIVQEAVTNAMRYAGKSRPEVLVRYCPDAVELEISDDGPGLTVSPGAGHGLAGMRERASLYGGVLEAGPRAERGFAVRARLPR